MKSATVWNCDRKSSSLFFYRLLFSLFLCFEEAKGVSALPILPDLEVQVISGRIAGGADIADYLALLHFLPNGHADGGTMGIQSVISIVVLHLDVVPIPAAPGVDGVGNGDCAICRCQNRWIFTMASGWYISPVTGEGNM